MEAFLEHLRLHGNGGRGLRDKSLTTARYRLVAMLDGVLDDAVTDLKPRIAERLYADRTGQVKPDTHRGELALVQAAGNWWVSKGWVRVNPFAEVQPVGARSSRKKQLRVDPTRRFIAVALGEGSPVGVAAAMALMLGLRASEIVERLVKDVDDGGRLLWVTDAKTAAGERELEIPEGLRPYLEGLLKGKRADERIFSFTRYALYYHVKRLCRLAGVDEVCIHGLRGTFATLSERNGTSTAAVARTLGHAGTGVTNRHYIEPGAGQSAAAERLADLLMESRSATMLAESFPEGDGEAPN